MAIKFPENWCVLKWPHQRAELLGFIDELASPDYQEDIDDVFHFFFDDTDLAGGLASNLRIVLFDEREWQLMQDLTKRLNAMLSKLGNADSASFLNHPDWGGVVQSAQKAKDVLSEQGRPEIF